MSLLLNDGSGAFESLRSWKSGLGTNGYPRRLAWVDLDRKGELLLRLGQEALPVFELP